MRSCCYYYVTAAAAALVAAVAGDSLPPAYAAVCEPYAAAALQRGAPVTTFSAAREHIYSRLHAWLDSSDEQPTLAAPLDRYERQLRRFYKLCLQQDVTDGEPPPFSSNFTPLIFPAAPILQLDVRSLDGGQQGLLLSLGRAVDLPEAQHYFSSVKREMKIGKSAVPVSKAQLADLARRFGFSYALQNIAPAAAAAQSSELLDRLIELSLKRDDWPAWLQRHTAARWLDDGEQGCMRMVTEVWPQIAALYVDGMVKESRAQVQNEVERLRTKVVLNMLEDVVLQSDDPSRQRVPRPFWLHGDISKVRARIETGAWVVGSPEFATLESAWVSIFERHPETAAMAANEKLPAQLDAEFRHRATVWLPALAQSSKPAEEGPAMWDVNAYYSPELNKIWIPPALLLSPFREALLALVGHEIGHALLFEEDAGEDFPHSEFTVSDGLTPAQRIELLADQIGFCVAATEMDAWERAQLFAHVTRLWCVARPNSAGGGAAFAREHNEAELHPDERLRVKTLYEQFFREEGEEKERETMTTATAGAGVCWWT